MSYSYTLTIGATTFSPSDMEKIIDSSTLKIVKPFCSTKKTSGTGTMSVTIKGAADPAFYQSFMIALLGAQQAQEVKGCQIVINEGNKAVFRGFLDLSNIQINSAKLPQNLTLSAMDKSTLLDKKIRMNKAWENEKRSTIISELLEYLEDDYGTPVSLLSDVLPATKKIKRFAVTEAKEQTYREVIDRILLESAGYVLWYDPAYDGFRIVKIQTDLTGLTPRTVEYLVKNQLQTKSAIYEKDGVLLSFPNIVERPNTNIYTENISVSKDEDNNVIGQDIPYQHYFPSDGDVKEIYQQYRVPDRPYISHESRLQNEDLKLIYCKDVEYSMQCNPKLSIAPALPNVKWREPEYYPDRARLLFINNNKASSYFPSEDIIALDAKDYFRKEGTRYVLITHHTVSDNPKALGWYEAKGANLSAFSITGTAVYEDYLNKVTVGKLDPDPITGYGSPCTNPEEYKAETIQYMNGDTDFSEAIDFAKWYFKSLNYGQTTSQWTELPGNSYLGEVVYVAHKMTGIMMPHIVVQITDESIDGSRVRMNRVVAISIYGWQEYVYDNGVSANGNNGQATDRANTIATGSVLVGTSTCRGVAGIVGDIYINTDANSTSFGNMYKCIVAGSAFTAVWQYQANIKGSDASVTGMTYEIQYGLSTSDEEFVFPVAEYGYDADHSYGINSDDSYGFLDYDWSSNTDNWYKGLYVWQRIKITDADGNITLEEPIYAKDLTDSLIASCKFDILPTSEYFVVNKANSTDSQTYTAILLVTGYSPSDMNNPITNASVLNEDGTSTGISNVHWAGNIVYFDVAYNTSAKQIKITVTGKFAETSSCAMIADDQTEYDPFGGMFPSVKDAVSTVEEADALAEAWFTSHYGGVIEGSTYSLNISGSSFLSLRTYLGDSWAFLSQSPLDKSRISAICGKAQHSVLSMVEKGSVTASDYGYFNIIIANIITADYIGSKQIQIKEDENRNPGYIYGLNPNNGSVDPSGAKGHRVSGQAFIIDSDGVSEFSESHSRNLSAETINLVGSLNMYRNFDTSSDEAGADILHPSFSTTPAIAGDPVGIEIETPEDSGITEYDPAIPTGKLATENTLIKSGINGTFKGNAITKMIKVTNPDTAMVSPRNGTSGTIEPTGNPSSPISTYTASYTFTIPDDADWSGNQVPVNVNISNSVSSSGSFGAMMGGTITLKVGSTTIASKTISGGWQRTPTSLSISGTAHFGDTVTLTVVLQYVITGSDWAGMKVSWSTSALTLTYLGFTNGLWLYSNNAWTNLGSTPLVEADNRLIISTPIYYNSRYFVLPTTLYNYTSYVVDGVTHNIEIGRAYKAEGTLVIDGAINVALNTLVRTATGVMLYTSIGEFSLTIGEQYYISTQSNIKILGSTRGISMEGCYPKKNFNDNGGYDCGTSGLKWNYGWFNICNANQFNDTSKADSKENVHPYVDSAMKILNKTEIVTFNYKEDPEKNWHIGFLADYTPEEIAGKNHDSMIINHCIGMLIKAVQELSAEIEKLKGGNK